MSKINFKINVHEIDNGFIVRIKNQRIVGTIELGETFCDGLEDVVKQIKIWTEKIQESQKQIK